MIILIELFHCDLLQVDDHQDLSDPMLLKNLDPKCVRSLNGCRVTVILVQLLNHQKIKNTSCRMKF